MSCENNPNRASSAAGSSGGITSTSSKSAFSVGVQRGGQALTTGAAASANYISRSRAYRIGRAMGKITFMPMKATQKAAMGTVKAAGKGVVGGVKLGLGAVKNAALFTAGFVRSSPVVEEAIDIGHTAKGAVPHVRKVVAAGQQVGSQVQKRLRPQGNNEGVADSFKGGDDR